MDSYVSDKVKPDSERDKTRYTPLSTAFMEEETRYRRMPKQNQPGTKIESVGATMSSADNPNYDETDQGGPPATGSSFGFNKDTTIPILKTNQYQVRKSAARALMDAALMMANISQLRTIIELGHSNTQHYYVLLVLIIFSLSCQVIFAILMFILLMRESEMAQRKDFLEHLQMLESKGIATKRASEDLRKQIAKEQEDFKYNRLTSRLNYVTMFLVFVITVVNMFITGFGIRDK